MSKFDVVLSKTERATARLTLKASIAFFSAKKQAKKVARLEVVQSAVSKKNIELTSGQCNALRRSAFRSIRHQLKALESVKEINAKHVTSINNLKALARGI